MQGHVEADERVEALHHEADSNTEEGMEVHYGPGDRPCAATTP